jgi:hypothetical protein
MKPSTTAIVLNNLTEISSEDMIKNASMPTIAAAGRLCHIPRWMV